MQHYKEHTSHRVCNKNISAYIQKLSCREWMEEYMGKYVAFYEGKLILSAAMDRDKFLKLVRKEAPIENVFVTQVDRILKTPTLQSAYL